MKKQSWRTRAARLLGPLAGGMVVMLAAACGGQGNGGGGATGKTENTQGAATEGASGGGAGGVVWTNMSFDQVLAKAKETNKMVLVDVWSDHCMQCGVMDQEIWDTPEAPRLVGDAIPIKIPSDAPESYSFRYKYPITGLPAVLLLDSDGTEINRVVGYVNKSRWLTDAHSMMTGVDPLPDMEAELKANPNKLPLYVPLLETYLYRRQEDKAQQLMQKVLELDPANAAHESEKAIRAMAKYYAYFLMDASGSARYWKMLAEKFPSSTSVGGALKETYDQAKDAGQVDQWIDWACGLSREHPDQGQFNSTLAMFAYRQKLVADCLAEAARNAKRVGAGPAGIDTVAVILEGKQPS
jgi:hypothetical protein